MNNVTLLYSSIRAADMTFQDEKILDLDKITSKFVSFFFIQSNIFFCSQKSVNTIKETTDTFPSSTITTTENKLLILYFYFGVFFIKLKN
jgi:hypothetical protein